MTGSPGWRGWLVDEAYVVDRPESMNDPLLWLREHSDTIEPGFRILVADFPIPNGGSITLLGVGRGGVLVIVERMGEGGAQSCETILQSVAFVRRRKEWLRKLHREENLQPGFGIRLILVGDTLPTRLEDALSGLAVDSLLILRCRPIRSDDGRRLLLIERKEQRMKERFDSAPRMENDVSSTDSILDDQERRFFDQWEAEFANSQTEGALW